MMEVIRCTPVTLWMVSAVSWSLVSCMDLMCLCECFIWEGQHVRLIQCTKMVLSFTSY
jgi:hypothetical protein